MLHLQEIFLTHQGESTDAGQLTVFVRLWGCNQKCTYCDQPQTSKKSRVSVEKLLYNIRSFKVNRVCVTGGEPLLQPEVYPLVYDMVGSGMRVSIETNGCVPIDEDPYRRSYKYIMDVKCPSSGISDNNVLSNLAVLHDNDEVKFVISNRADYEYALKIIKGYPTVAKLLFSPVFNKNGKSPVGKELSDWLAEDRLEKVRIQIQMHKVLNIK